jgi:alpha-L-fucosidase
MVLALRKQVRTAAELIDIYYTSVGRNGNMLLNLSPDTRGLIPDNQLAQLRLMAQVVDETFAKDLALEANSPPTIPTRQTAHRWLWMGIWTPGGKPLLDRGLPR